MDVFLTGVLGWAIAQFSKLVLYRIHSKEWKLAVLTISGGMPSSHTAFITAASFRVGMLEGFFSPLFGLALTMMSIVMYDAIGVRKSVGEQSQMLNKILEELSDLIKSFDEESIKVVMGHTFLQVAVGFWIGVLVGLFSGNIQSFLFNV